MEYLGIFLFLILAIFVISSCCKDYNKSDDINSFIKKHTIILGFECPECKNQIVNCTTTGSFTNNTYQVCDMCKTIIKLA